MKKIMTLVLVIVMLASLCLTGCNTTKPTDPTKGTDAPDTKPTETTAPQLEEKTVQIWLGGAGKQKDSEKVWKAFNELLKNYVPNTTVEFTIFPFGEYGEKFTQMIAGEEPVDLAWTGWVVNKPNNIKDGNIIPLDDLIANYGKDIVEVLGQGVMDAHVYNDGHTYQIVSWQGLYGARQAIYLVTDIVKLIEDKDWVAKAQAACYKFDNEPNGENLRAFLNLMEKYYEAAKKAGKLGAGWDARGYSGWNWIYGTDYGAANYAGIHTERYNDNLKATYHFATECAKVYFEVMASWFDKGYIRNDFQSAKGLAQPKDGKITADTYISYGEGYWSEDTIESTAAAWGMDVTAILRQEHGEVTKGDSTGFSVPYCADEPERAMMVLNAIYANKDLYNLLIFGIEGEHYTVNADGTIKTDYEGNNPTTENAYGLQRWVIGSCKNSLINNGTDPDYYAGLEKLEKDPATTVSVWNLFVLDTTKTSDMTTAFATINKKYGSGNNIIAAGSKGWEKMYNDWMAELKAAKLDDYVAEVQRQIDAWKKANNITGVWVK